MSIPPAAETRLGQGAVQIVVNLPGDDRETSMIHGWNDDWLAFLSYIPEKHVDLLSKHILQTNARSRSFALN